MAKNSDEQLIVTYVPHAEELSFEDALKEAEVRDAEAAEDLLNSILEEGE